MGLCRVRLGQHNQAMQAFNAALRNSEHTEAHYQMALELLTNFNNPKLAITHLKIVTSVRPSDAEAHYRLGLCYLRINKVDDAIGEMREALRLRPDWPEAANDLAWILATAPDPKLRGTSQALR